MTRVELVVDTYADPIRGELRTAAGPDRPFRGWIQLMHALDALSADASAREGDAAPDHQDGR